MIQKQEMLNLVSKLTIIDCTFFVDEIHEEV